MKPLLPLAIVDLETTGTHAGGDAITEIGIVRLDPQDDGRVRTTEWSSLVNPGVPIPPAIQALTGISDAMVAHAPSFVAIAARVRALLADAVFVAHNARFDFGFLKHAFARAGHDFRARVLCTVRLSRRLYPQAEGHGLDALVARHDLAARMAVGGQARGSRHRALSDARAVLAFVQHAYSTQPQVLVDDVARRILRLPSLPPQLAPDALDRLPERPGVYLLYGDNPLPLYVGKSINLRERVAAHFSCDWRSETDLRLSREVRRIEHEETAGELGALVRESVLVKQRMPAHNRALRRKAEAGVMVLHDDAPPRFLAAAKVDPSALAGTYGPFASRAAARACLREQATQHGLCWRRLGLERRPAGPCFARQVHRCRGACVGEEPAQAHDLRLAASLASLRIPAWPLEGEGVVREARADGTRVELHAFSHWSYLGTAADDAALRALLGAASVPSFDLDITRLLLRRHAAGTLALEPAAPAGAQPMPSAGAAAATVAPAAQRAACAASTSATHSVSFLA